MTKKEIIKEIFDNSKIHHNIHTDYRKVRQAIDKANLTDEEQESFNKDGNIESYLIDDFIEMFEGLKMNDSGNRNLCGCKKFVCKKEDFKTDNEYNGRVYCTDRYHWKSYAEAKKEGLIDKMTSDFIKDEQGFMACRRHDLWHIYNYGGMGATLYWDKYWEGKNSGFYFNYDECELEEKELYELKEMLKEIKEFNKMIDDLMIRYYAELEYQAKEHKQQIKDDKKQTRYNSLIEPYNVNLFELSKSKDDRIKRIAISLTKLLNIK